MKVLEEKLHNELQQVMDAHQDKESCPTKKQGPKHVGIQCSSITCGDGVADDALGSKAKANCSNIPYTDARIPSGELADNQAGGRKNTLRYLKLRCLAAKQQDGSLQHTKASHKKEWIAIWKKNTHRGKMPCLHPKICWIS